MHGSDDTHKRKRTYRLTSTQLLSNDGTAVTEVLWPLGRMQSRCLLRFWFGGFGRLARGLGQGERRDGAVWRLVKDRCEYSSRGWIPWCHKVTACSFRGCEGELGERGTGRVLDGLAGGEGCCLLCRRVTWDLVCSTLPTHVHQLGLHSRTGSPAVRDKRSV